MDKPTIQKVIIVGGFHEVIELCESCQCEIVGIIDTPNLKGYCGYPILGADQDASSLFDAYKDCKIVITPDSPKLREKLANYYSGIGYEFATIISPDARISKSAKIGEGSIIQAGVNVSAATEIGRFCKLNTNANVMHDNEISDFVTIAPNTVSLGRIKIGKGTYIGANSTILPEIVIGDYSTVGAGAVVTKNVPRNTVVKGVPAK